MKPVLALAAAAAMAAPTALFGPIAQADRVNWVAVARCESGGDWSASTGNGAYGGLQIKPSTWESNGGIGLPSQASPQQQVTVAKRILETQGPGAWPSCMSRIRDDQNEMPVGTLNHFMSYIVDQLEIAVPRRPGG